MTERVDCRVFEDQLDALIRGELPEEGRALLRAHAAACAECHTLLRLQEHLSAPSLEALEERVPDGWVTSMWTDVRSALEAPSGPGAGEGPKGRQGTPRRRGARWAVPLLSAATLALLFVSGLGVRDLRRAEAREATLTAQLLDQQRRLAQLDGPASGRPLRGARLTGGETWLRALEERREITVAELRGWLHDLPADTRLIRGPRSGTLDASRLVPGVWRAALARMETTEGVTPEDLLTVLDDLDLADDASVSTARLIEFFS